MQPQRQRATWGYDHDIYCDTIRTNFGATSTAEKKIILPTKTDDRDKRTTAFGAGALLWRWLVGLQTICTVPGLALHSAGFAQARWPATFGWAARWFAPLPSCPHAQTKVRVEDTKGCKKFGTVVRAGIKANRGRGKS